MKILFFIVLILLSFCLTAQSTNPWFSKVIKKINSIQKNEYDSVFSSIFISGSPDWPEKINGVEINKEGEAILIGFKKERISCIKLIQGSGEVFSSKPINLNSDTAIQDLRTNTLAFELENFLPYICEASSDSTENIKGFYPKAPPLHTSFCSIYFKCSTNSGWNEFYPECLSEISGGYPPNLNFKFNSSLKSYKLYCFLNMLLKKYESKFDFGK